MEPDVTTSDCYATLHVARDASLDVIHAAYRAQAKTAHPDRGGDEAAFRVLQEAYETLCDPDRRAHLDWFLDTHQTPTAPRSTTSTRDRVYVADPLAEDLPSGWYRDTNGQPHEYRRSPGRQPHRSAPAPTPTAAARPVERVGFLPRLAGVVVLACVIAVGVLARVSGATYAVFHPVVGQSYLAWRYDGVPVPDLHAAYAWIPWVVVAGLVLGGVWTRRERLGVHPVERSVLIVTVLVLAVAGEFVLASPTAWIVVAAIVAIEAALWVFAAQRADRT
jgi:hypothetical protein